MIKILVASLANKQYANSRHIVESISFSLEKSRFSGSFELLVGFLSAGEPPLPICASEIYCVDWLYKERNIGGANRHKTKWHQE